MRKPSRRRLHSLNRKRRPDSRSAKDATLKYIPNDLASLNQRALPSGGRAASECIPPITAVSPAENGGQSSLKMPLRRELGTILKNIGKQSAGIGGKAARKDRPPKAEQKIKVNQR